MYFCSKSGFKMWFVALKNGWGYAEKQVGLQDFRQAASRKCDKMGIFQIKDSKISVEE